jgi:hypothetical protein
MRIFEFEKLVAVLARVARAFFFLYNDNDGARAKAKGGRDVIRVSQSRIGREYAY